VSDIAGKLAITLFTGGAAPAASIRSSRPLTAAQVFTDKPLASVSGQLPLLFSVCGTAQSVACALACEAALGWTPVSPTVRARDLLLRAETVKEHLWRLLLDWPNACAHLDGVEAAGLAARHAEREAAMAAVMRAFLQLRGMLGARGDPCRPGANVVRPPDEVLAAAARALAETAAGQVFATAPADWLAEIATAADMHAWAARTDGVAAVLVRSVSAAGLADLGRCEVGVLPSMGAGGAVDSGLLQRFADALVASDTDSFVAAPTVAGQPAETTPFARELGRGGLVADLAAIHGNGLLPRLGALLVELARDCARLAAMPLDGDGADDAPAVGGLAPVAGVPVGAGAVQAARGLLVHRVELDAGPLTDEILLRDYRILAPTEWNFHPAGVVAAGLTDIARAPALTAAERARRARLVITAVDPCVDYELSIF
jgi:hypothetical protein